MVSVTTAGGSAEPALLRCVTLRAAGRVGPQPVHIEGPHTGIQSGRAGASRRAT